MNSLKGNGTKRCISITFARKTFKVNERWRTVEKLNSKLIWKFYSRVFMILCLWSRFIVPRAYLQPVRMYQQRIDRHENESGTVEISIRCLFRVRPLWKSGNFLVRSARDHLRRLSLPWRRKLWRSRTAKIAVNYRGGELCGDRRGLLAPIRIALILLTQNTTVLAAQKWSKLMKSCFRTGIADVFFFGCFVRRTESRQSNSVMSVVRNRDSRLEFRDELVQVKELTSIQDRFVTVEFEQLFLEFCFSTSCSRIVSCQSFSPC